MTISESKSYLHGLYARKGMTQAQVATDVLYIAPATLSRYMSGTLAWPADAIIALTDYFFIPKADVYDVFLVPYRRK